MSLLTCRCYQHYVTCRQCVVLRKYVIHRVSAYFEHGMVVHDVTRLRHHYVTSAAFKLDLLSVLPTDVVFCFTYQSYVVVRRSYVVVRQSYVVVARLNRVLRMRRLWELFERTESSTSSPNSFRIGVLVFYLLTAIHWNACFYFLMSAYNGFGSDDWVYVDINETLYPKNATLLKMYSYRLVDTN